jgi:hypothetical protein
MDHPQSTRHPRRLPRVQALLAPLGSADPGDGLRAIEQIRRELDSLETELAADALRGGASWSQIGAALGISKQAAHRRHSRSVRSLDRAAEAEDHGRPVIVTAEARAAVSVARREAYAAGAQAVGTEHLLLGLLRAADAQTLNALRRVGLTAQHTRSLLEETAETPLDGMPEAAQPRPDDRRASASARPVPAVSPVAQRVLASALRERADRRSGPLSARDLLLALLREPNGGASRTLERLGVSRDELKLELARE